MILFMMTDELGNDEYSKFKKLKDKNGIKFVIWLSY